MLRTAEHFERFSGERVRVDTLAPINGRKRFSGRLKQVRDGQIALEVDGSVLMLPIDAIHKARVAPET